MLAPMSYADRHLLMSPFLTNGLEPVKKSWTSIACAMTACLLQPMADTKSGDNDALKVMLRQMTSAERAERIALPPQCAMNSYLWRPSARQWVRYFTQGGKVRKGFWRPGHLLVHLAGWDNYNVRLSCYAVVGALV